VDVIYQKLLDSYGSLEAVLTIGMRQERIYLPSKAPYGTLESSLELNQLFEYEIPSPVTFPEYLGDTTRILINCIASELAERERELFAHMNGYCCWNREQRNYCRDQCRRCPFRYPQKWELAEGQRLKRKYPEYGNFKARESWCSSRTVMAVAVERDEQEKYEKRLVANLEYEKAI
jgi:hypothetical protein